MEYCLGDGDGSATMWSAPADLDLDGDATLEAVGMDVDRDGADDAMLDLDGDGLADQLVRDHAANAAYFSDDGTGTWAVSVDRGGHLRWFGLDGVEHSGGPLNEHSGGPMVDLDGDGQARERLVDADGNGVADRGMGDGTAFVDTDGDGTWDVKLTDSDGDGRADAAAQV